MRRPITALFAAALALGLFIAVPGFAHHPGDHPQGKHGSNGKITDECPDADGEVIYEGPLEMWPPNHKYRDLTVTAEADNPGDEVTLNTEGTHDEYADHSDPENPEGELNGAGNTENDIDPFVAMDGPTQGSAQTEHSVRAERSGRGDGRTYTIMYQATFNGEPCTGEFEIEVPHSQGRSDENKNVHQP